LDVLAYCGHSLLREPLKRRRDLVVARANPAAAIRSQRSPKKRPYKNYENHSGSAGSTPPEFCTGHHNFTLAAASEILPNLKNRCVTVGGDLAFCLLDTAPL